MEKAKTMKTIMKKATSKYVMVDGVKTHYLEGGDGPPLVLLHSGEFGASAELTWEYNIDALTEHFRVIAPDWLGYGKTDKIFDFGNMLYARIHHITRFLETLCIGKAHFMGNSMGATVLLGHAAEEHPEWNMDRIVSVSGGGHIPENDFRQMLNNYDGSREHMALIIRSVYMRTDVHDDDDFIDRRHQSSLEPGAWECTAAARFRSPFTPPRGYGRSKGYQLIKPKTLLIAGEKDNLREPGYAEPIHAEIPNSELVVLKGAGHAAHVDQPDVVSKLAIDFLTAPD
ncbi:MAG: alpha/beta hydrolase [Pseudooceanicola sp.]|uniref:Alpha/beta hydrolase n=2 Tax=Arenibacterium halophilum TaxID=2583821 RepID=A0ABY2X1Y9_9RHOB|nr:alpha/beta hydrolase [Pseudooceanicola sp.]TMV09287.1 alpha/beta hydrolase [Arenibacterium halophilum]|tara:strand:+ start:427 stop:1281 length:855 start_codon:yes stop_codon:yes gene_type:complete